MIQYFQQTIRRAIYSMKKTFTSLIIIVTLLCGIKAFASETELTIDLTITDNGAIVIPETARFNLFTADGEWLANEACEIFKDTQAAAVHFKLPEYEAGTVYRLVPTKGITKIQYNGVSYGIGDALTLDTSESSSFSAEAIPLFVPPTGLRADSVTFYFDILNTGTPLVSEARFNLFDKDGQWLANDAISITGGGVRKSLTFNIADYYTGDTFYLCPTVGMTDVSYNGAVFNPDEMIELQTYAYTDENGAPQKGTFFHLNLTPLYKLPSIDNPGAFGASAEAFVNNSGVSSATNYLIWVSKKDYKVCVFLGSTGNWQYVKAFDCAIGAPSTPTITGQFEYYMYQPRWTYDTYYVGPVMRFAKGGYAIHSTLLRYDGSNADGRLRMKISHGCVRVAPGSINWLVDYIPLHTRVYITE